jgi:hypothetical protein
MQSGADVLIGAELSASCLIRPALRFAWAVSSLAVAFLVSFGAPGFGHTDARTRSFIWFLPGAAVV